MRYALMSEPQQGLAYAEILALARAVEAAPALGAYFRSDHYGSFPGPGDQPTTDAWATVAGLARETSRIGLGTLVSPVTYRLPGNLAKVVATVDEMSGGRVELGLGAGWHEREHAAHGFAFPPLPERYDMLEETLAIVHGLWREPDGWSLTAPTGRSAMPRFERARRADPGGPHPPLILGGEGGPRFAALAARLRGRGEHRVGTPVRVRRAYARVREACAEIGRDPGELTYSAMTGFLVAATEADLRAAHPGPDRVHRGGCVGRHDRRGSVAGGAPNAVGDRYAGRGARAHRAARRGWRRAPHAPGFPAARPRPGSRHRADRGRHRRRARPSICATLRPSGSGPTGAHATPT